MSGRVRMMAILSAFVLSQAVLLSAGVVYDRTNNCLWVVDYLEAQPATLHTLLEADQQNGWGKVSHQPETDTYTVDAAIWIGNHSGYSTFFQVGDRQHPKLKLVLKGSLWIRPAAMGINRTDGSPSIMNSLTVGDPADPTITPQILFDCATPGEHGIFGGLRQKSNPEQTCKLRMYNASFAALKTNAPQHRWGSGDYRAPGPGNQNHTMGCYVSEFRLENCRFADFVGPLFYGADTIGWNNRERRLSPNEAKTIRNCRFENGGTALASQQYLSSCVFRNLEQPVSDNGSLFIWGYDCTFETNRYNWALSGYASYGVTLVDCRIAPQSKPMQMKKNTYPRPEQRISEYPVVRIMKSLRVRVMDAQGKPVPMASVTVLGNGPVDQPSGLTAADGWTGADPRTDGTAVTIKQYTAGDDPAKPLVSEDFRYEITATAGGKSVSKSVQVGDLAQPIVLTFK